MIPQGKGRLEGIWRLKRQRGRKGDGGDCRGAWGQQLKGGRRGPRSSTKVRRPQSRTRPKREENVWRGVGRPKFDAGRYVVLPGGQGVAEGKRGV